MDGLRSMVKNNKTRVFLVACGITAVAVVAACGGGSVSDEAADPVSEAERAHALGLFDKLPVSWTPERVTLDVTRGTTQSVQVAVTTTKTLRNARVVFLPDLRNAVTVLPATIPTLAAGQSATVTLTFAPTTTDMRRVIAGVVLLYDRNATVSRPLFVQARLQDRAPFVNTAGGYQFVPPTGWQTIESGKGLTTLIPPGKTASVENSYLGDIFVEPRSNPTNLSLSAYYAQVGSVNLYAASASQTPLTVNGIEAVRFDDVVGMLPSTVVALKLTGRIVEVIDYRDHASDGVLDAVVSTFSEVR
jgi:hypothetical protein